MAINSNPLFAPGQNIPAAELQRLRDLQASGQTYRPGGGRFDPFWYHSTSTSFPDGVREGSAEVTSNGPSYIVQPRNISTWGGNDTTDMWDEQGRYVGTNSAPTTARNLARLGAAAVGGYYGAAMGAEAGAGAGLSGAEAGAGSGAFLGEGVASGVPAWDAAAGLSGVEAGTAAGSTLVDGSSGASSFKPSLNYGEGLTGAQTRAYDSVIGATGSPGLANAASQVTGAMGGMGMDWVDLARLGMAAYGASQSRDRNQTQSRDPWAPAQPFLLNQLATGAQLQQRLQEQPFNPMQQQAMQQKLGLLNGLNSQVMPGLLSGLGTATQGYQRPGGPAARAPAFNFGGQGLLASMQGSPIDFAAMNPYRKG